MSLDRTLTLRNWFDAPQNRQGFTHVRELVPTARIPRDGRDPSPLVAEPLELDNVRIAGDDDSLVCLSEYLDRSFTDGFMAVLGGKVVYERYFNGSGPQTMHLLHSISKSYCAALAGVLIGRGSLGAGDLVTDLAPDLRGTSFEGATVRHLLDMRTGTYCPEDYLATEVDAPFVVYSVQAGYGPLDGREAIGILGHMHTLTNARSHGGPFEYRSVIYNVLARVLETVADTPYPELLARELWAPLAPEFDAEIMLDPFRFPPVEGGMSCTLRDLARLGEAYREDGRVGDTQVIPATWIQDTCTGDEDALRAYAESGVEMEFPAIMYRSGWWTIERGNRFAGLGIHGQLLYVDRARELTIARVASEPQPDYDRGRATLLRAADAIADHNP